MRKLIILSLFLLIVIVIVSGCIQIPDPETILKANPQVKEFLIDHPNAEIGVKYLSQESVSNDNDFVDKCEGVSLGAYYKITIDDPDSDLSMIGWVDLENQRVVCVFKKGVPTPCVESWTCTDWVPSPCPSSEQQTRICIDINNCNTTNNKPSETQSCEYVCLEDWSCTPWSDCINNTRRRICADLNNCGTEENKPDMSQSCAATCTELWNCTEWGSCVNGIQTRSCIDINNCGTNVNKPAVSKSCEVQVTACNDSDGGKNYNVKGIVKADATYADNCFGSYLTEWFCEETGKVNSIAVVCNCVDGACIDEATVPICTDSDNGNNLRVRGYVAMTGGTPVYDYCRIGNQISEFVCREDKKSYKFITQDCPPGTVCIYGGCFNESDKPDLTIINVTYSDYTSPFGEKGILVPFVTQNIGEFPALEIKVTYFKNGEEHGSVIIHGLAPNESTEQYWGSLFFDYDSHCGSVYNVSYVVDPDNLIDEINENNNDAKITVSIPQC